jgi:hypothetical protein
MHLYTIIARTIIALLSLVVYVGVSAETGTPENAPVIQSQTWQQDVKNAYFQKKTTFQKWYVANNKEVYLIPQLVKAPILDFLAAFLALGSIFWIILRKLFS